jgi:hypothetical protein
VVLFLKLKDRLAGVVAVPLGVTTSQFPEPEVSPAVLVAIVKDIAVLVVPASELVTGAVLKPVFPIVTEGGACSVCAHPGAAISNAITGRRAEVLRSL